MGMVGEQMIQTFNKLVEDQFIYGAKKYADSSSTKKETTDILFETFGPTWLYGTICKYTFRYENVKREKDLLKIATYAYLLWLKRGFFLNTAGTSVAQDTNVRIKADYFSSFLNRIILHEKTVADTEHVPSMIRAILVEFSDIDRSWGDITEEQIAHIFLLAYKEWSNQFALKAGQDTDTHNDAETD